jgi:hypothetical protein
MVVLSQNRNPDILMMQAAKELESLRCVRSSASGESRERLYPTKDEAELCNTKVSFSGGREGALRRTPRSGRVIRDGSIRSVAQHARFATAIALQ